MCQKRCFLRTRAVTSTDCQTNLNYHRRFFFIRRFTTEYVAVYGRTYSAPKSSDERQQCRHLHQTNGTSAADQGRGAAMTRSNETSGQQRHQQHDERQQRRRLRAGGSSVNDDDRTPAVPTVSDERKQHHLLHSEGTDLQERTRPAPMSTHEGSSAKVFGEERS